MTKYIRYFLMTAVLLATTVGIAMGGAWLWFGFVLSLVLVVGGDAVLGSDLDEPVYSQSWLLDFLLYLTLPLLLLLLATFAWMLGTPGTDWLRMGALVSALTGWDMQAARAATGGWHVLGGVFSTGLMVALAGTNVGHELTHRTWSKPAMVFGRWMLAMSADASFAIEHVYGHHLNVATYNDPATARRGENTYAFIVRSTVYSYLSAWHIEGQRLAKRGISIWSWQNRMHRGNLMTLAYAAAFYLAAGWVGVGIYIVTAAWGKSLLEFVNYMEHYGIVRVPGTKVEARHSWNANQRISGYVLYNLTRHSHHHAEADVPFWKTRAYPEAPMMHFGYLTMILITMIPPLYQKMMVSKLQDWDERFANSAERTLAAQANAASGMPELMLPTAPT